MFFIFLFNDRSVRLRELKKAALNNVASIVLEIMGIDVQKEMDSYLI